MAYEISSQWTALSILTRYPIGQQLNIQNAGRAGDLLEIIISNTQPVEGDRSYVVRNLDPLYRVSGQSKEVWVRYIRYDLTGTITPLPARKCLMNVSDNDQITQSSTFPLDSNSATMQAIIRDLVCEMTEASKENTAQLILLNARFEEAFETGIFEDDM